MKNSDKKIKIFTLLAIMTGVVVVASSALAVANLSFSLSGGTSYTVGNTFTANIVVSPAEKVYTVKAQVSYPANLLKIESFTFNSNWIPLSQPGYDAIDNSAGILMKTAGYPGGISSQTVFGTATFRVLNPGNANLKFASDSFALSANNANVAGSLASLDLTLTSPIISTCSCTAWSSWQSGICGGGACLDTQRLQTRTRTCTPAGCNIESGSQCIEDSSCVPAEEEVVPPKEEVIPPEGEIVVVLPEEKATEVGLASMLAAIGIEISQSAWKMIIVILGLTGLILIGVREWKIVQEKKRKSNV